MKKHYRFSLAVVALVLTATLCLGGCKMVDEPTQTPSASATSTATKVTFTPSCTADPDMDGVTVAVVNGVKLTRRDFVQMYNRFREMYQSENKSLDAKTDEGRKNLKALKQEAIDEIIKFELFRQKAEKDGCMNLTSEETSQVITSIDGAVSDYVDSMLEEAKKKNEGKSDEEVRKILEDEFWASAVGYNRDSAIKQQLDLTGINKYITGLTERVVAKDSDVRAYYEELKKEQKKNFTQDPSLYEQALGSGETVAYTPGGMYRIQSILIKISDEDSDKYYNLTQEGKEKEAEKALEEALKKVEGKARDVLKQAQKKGADFEKLIVDYGQDPGMNDEGTRKEGYLVYDGCKTWTPNFVVGAMKLKKVGDVSEDIVATPFGYFVLKLYKMDKEGYTPYENIMEKLEDAVLPWAKNKFLDEKFKEFRAEAKIELFEDKMTVD